MESCKSITLSACRVTICDCVCDVAALCTHGRFACTGCQDHENTLGDSVSNDNEKGVSVALFAISLLFSAFSYSSCL
jgi:hypothetical protein